MKSRVTTYLLLASVVAVWSAIAWKICAPASDTAPSPRPEPAAPTAAAPARDSLRLDYPDPFLKEAPRKIVRTRSAVRVLPAAKPAPPLRERVKLVHLGTVAAAGQRLYILTVDDVQYEVACGESAGAFVLTASDEDSLYLQKNGVRYAVKCCER